jgi:four helix bundle protein
LLSLVRMSQPHETLIAWQRADDLCYAVYELTKRFPREERFGLTSQIQRAAFSVPANIVEGYAFSKSPSRTRFLRISVGSLAELGYALHFAKRVGYLSDDDWNVVDQLVRQTAAPLHGLLKQQSARG